MTMQADIQTMIDKFHRKVEKDENLREKLDDVVKTINLDLGSEKYSLTLTRGKITNFEEGLVDDADIVFTSTPENLKALIDGSLRPMKAYIMKKFTVKGKLEDIMHLKSLF